MSQDGKWMMETLEEGHTHQYRLGKSLFSGQSKFQSIEVMETVPFGNALMLDGLIQSAEKDEAFYHEALVHPAMTCHPNPKKVFIGGGGEGATLREVLKHASVDKCTMCDIDEDVVKLCEEHLKDHHEGALNSEDPRVELVYEDAKKWVEENGPWDVIILDLADPVEYGPCYVLYSTEFYKTCLDKLTPDGVFVTQSGPMSCHSFQHVFAPVHSTLKSVFPEVFPYGVHVPSFGHEWGFNIAVKNASAAGRLKESIASIDARLQSKVPTWDSKLKVYDGEAHTRMFHHTKFIRKALAAEKRVITMSNPIHFNAGKGILD